MMRRDWSAEYPRVGIDAGILELELELELCKIRVVEKGRADLFFVKTEGAVLGRIERGREVRGGIVSGLLLYC